MRRPRLQSTFARAVVPVAAGIGFFALLALGLWGVAALIASGEGEATENLSVSYFDVGRTDTMADIVAEGGPILLRDLLGDDRNFVLDHTGADPNLGWRLFLAYPADRAATCAVEQVKGTRQFTDCEGRTLDVSELAPPPAGVRPEVVDDRLLSLDLIADDATPATVAGAAENTAPAGTTGG